LFPTPSDSFQPRRSRKRSSLWIDIGLITFVIAISLAGFLIFGTW
jgi:hypothetical protein